MVLKRILTQTAQLLLLLFLLLISIFGLQDSPTTERKTVGSTNLETYKYGINLNQNLEVFYNLSPYDSYFIVGKDEKRTYASWDNEIFSKETQIQHSFLTSALESAIGSLNLNNPTATFDTEVGEVKFLTESKGNTITISLKSPETHLPRKSVLTLSYNTSDIIFDERGNTLNNPTPENVAKVANFYNFVFDGNTEATPETTESTKSTGKLSDTEYIFIFNPKATGVLGIDLSKNTGATINTQAGLIEFESYETTPQALIEVFSSFEEALGTND
jgi:hypothetical protein